MKKHLKNLFALSFITGIVMSCTPDYVTNSPNNPTNPSIPSNPSNPTEQSILLNFTQGEFIGVHDSNTFQNGSGVASKTNMNGEYNYLLLYTNGINQFNGFIVNKDSSQLVDSASGNSIHIIINGKAYTSTSGTFTLTQEQVMSSVSGTDMIKCKFTFNGSFEATPIDTFEVIETDVKINGTIIF